jgi:hypothetical protein
MPQRAGDGVMISIHRLTMYYLLAIPIVAGISTLQFDTGEFTFTGWIWVVQFFLGIALFTLVLFEPTSGRASAGRSWIPLCIWIWLSILWCRDPGRRNIQEAMQLCMPVLVGMLAARTIRTEVELKQFLRMFVVTFVLLAAFVYLYSAEAYDREWIEKRARPAALTTAFVGCVFLGGLSKNFWLSLSGWGACVLLTTLTQSRMATLALLSALVLYPNYRSKLVNLTGMVGIAVLALVLFYTPIFQERFFKGSGTISDVTSGDFESAGRFNAWPYILDEALKHPTLGTGVGSAFDYVPTVWKDSKYVHNDYLRMFFELGIVGLTLFVLAFVCQFAVLYRCINSSTGVVQTAFTICWLGFCVLMVSCATDNTILYNIYFTNPLFAVLGGASGVAYAESRAVQALDRASPRRRLVARSLNGRARYGGNRLAPD